MQARCLRSQDNYIHNCVRQQRDHYLVMPCDGVSFTSRIRGSFDDVLVGSVVLYHVEIRGGEFRHIMTQISGDTQRLQEDLRHDDRRPEIQQYASVPQF